MHLNIEKFEIKCCLPINIDFFFWKNKCFAKFDRVKEVSIFCKLMIYQGFTRNKFFIIYFNVLSFAKFSW